MRPGVFYKQRDLTQVVVGSEGTVAGIAVNANWGPVDTLIPLTNLDQYVQYFGKPISTSDTPGFYQALGWFLLGKGLYVNRPQGGSRYGGVESLKGSVASPIPAPLQNLPTSPSGLNVTGIYSRYPGLPDSGAPYINIYAVDNTTGQFSIEAGFVLNSLGDALDTGDDNYENHTVSVLKTAKDGFGRSAFIEEVLKRDSLILTGRAKLNALVDDVPLDSTSPVQLAQMSYTAASVSELSLAYDKFKSLSAVTIDVLIPGNFDAVILNKVAAVCIERGDCFYILSPDISITWTTDGVVGATGWKNDIASSLSWQGAAYADYYEVQDEYNDTSVYVPMAGFAAGALALTDSIAEPWYAPAGPQRAYQPNVLSLGKDWLGLEQDILYDSGVNYPVNSPTYGINLQGQKTLYGVNSALQRINVARLILKIKRDLMAYLESYLYEFNNVQTRNLIYSQVDSYLGGIMAGQGLYDYKVICDETNNTASVIDQNKLYVDIYLKPIRVAEFLYLRSTLVATGIEFSSIISQAA